ncbi:hypothetical protein D6C90_09641 [Aureobasidium pullulans]|uniref:Uncharacterized protein n=1 Tax=Aureobasidium pullulans TaxID=5580 RepID=A0A4S9T6L4_AURPU|nr:hypothetical protein D6C90_09641 [Aureobasidium pullulans]
MTESPAHRLSQALGERLLTGVTNGQSPASPASDAQRTMDTIARVKDCIRDITITHQLTRNMFICKIGVMIDTAKAAWQTIRSALLEGSIQTNLEVRTCSDVLETADEVNELLDTQLERCEDLSKMIISRIQSLLSSSDYRWETPSAMVEDLIRELVALVAASNRDSAEKNRRGDAFMVSYHSIRLRLKVRNISPAAMDVILGHLSPESRQFSVDALAAARRGMIQGIDDFLYTNTMTKLDVTIETLAEQVTDPALVDVLQSLKSYTSVMRTLPSIDAFNLVIKGIEQKADLVALDHAWDELHGFIGRFGEPEVWVASSTTSETKEEPGNTQPRVFVNVSDTVLPMQWLFYSLLSVSAQIDPHGNELVTRKHYNRFVDDYRRNTAAIVLDLLEQERNLTQCLRGIESQEISRHGHAETGVAIPKVREYMKILTRKFYTNLDRNITRREFEELCVQCKKEVALFRSYKAVLKVALDSAGTRFKDLKVVSN